MKDVFLSLFMPLGVVSLGLGYLVFSLIRKKYFRASLVRGSEDALVFWASLVWVFLVLFSIPAFASFLGGALFNRIEGRVLGEQERVDAIVVLTGGMLNTGPVGGWVPKPASIRRLAAAYELQRRIDIRTPVIISGGFTEGARAPSEARLLAEFFGKMRSEITPTEIEEYSTDTYESAVQVSKYLMKNSFKNVVLVTDDVHMFRAAAAYRTRGIDVIPAPVMSLPRGGLAIIYLLFMGYL